MSEPLIAFLVSMYGIVGLGCYRTMREDLTYLAKGNSRLKIVVMWTLAWAFSPIVGVLLLGMLGRETVKALRNRKSILRRRMKMAWHNCVLHPTAGVFWFCGYQDIGDWLHGEPKHRWWFVRLSPDDAPVAAPETATISDLDPAGGEPGLVRINGRRIGAHVWAKDEAEAFQGALAITFFALTAAEGALLGYRAEDKTAVVPCKGKQMISNAADEEGYW